MLRQRPRRGALTAAVLAGAAALACGGDAVETTKPVEDEPLPPGAVVDELATFDPARWQVMDHPLGRGRVAPENVVPAAGTVGIRLPKGSFDGGELRSAQRLAHGVVEGRLRSAAPPGSITAFFLYEGRARRNDEVDVELLGGTRTALLTVWREDQQVFHTSVTLDFDPSAGFHDYRITWGSDRVEWRVDGRLVATAGGLSLGTDLFLYVNAWWPAWLDGGPAAEGASAVVERLVT